MDGQARSQIRPGIRVRVVEKQNQRTGQLTEGVVQRILTKSPTHPHGIKVMLDSGVRSGLDMVRALALGAKCTFAGRPFLYAVGALGEDGPRHIVDMFVDELKTEFQHVGIRTVAEAGDITVRQNRAWRFEA